MYDFFLAQILILFLLGVTCGRIFFIQNAKIDACAIVTPVAFIVLILSFFIWGADISLILIAVLTLLVLITNTRAMLRLRSHLYVDHYSILFIVFSIAELILTAVLFVFVVRFRPVKYTPEQFNATSICTRLEKNDKTDSSAISAFRPVTSSFNKTDCFLYSYEPAKRDKDSQNRPVVIFVPGKRATVIQYEPYLLFLAQKGYTVLAADFYSSDTVWFSHTADSRLFRRMYAVALSIRHPDKYAKFEKKTSKQTVAEYENLGKIAKNIFGDEISLFAITDGISGDITTDIIGTMPQNYCGFFPLPLISEYKTAGYGFVEQTDLWLGHILGVKRDSSLFIPRYVANKTAEALALIAPRASNTDKQINPEAKNDAK